MPWQPSAVLYPDAETVIPARLRALLAARSVTDVYVGRDIPNPRRPRMVVWNRDGGGSDGLRDQPRMRCRVWAPTDAEANDLAALVVALVPHMVDGAPILRATHESGPYDVPDDSDQPQRYLMFEIHTRGGAAP